MMKNMNGSKSESKVNDIGYKIIEIKVKDPAEGLYAVCTPVKMK
ncbi:hypothetical protein [Bacillus dakarensis]|nr:hypothetical protein [Bacillus dakarensis]